MFCSYFVLNALRIDCLFIYRGCMIDSPMEQEKKSQSCRVALDGGFANHHLCELELGIQLLITDLGFWDNKAE